jgi:hypothetical protein
MLFSDRRQVARRAVEWCTDNGITACPFNIVTAINAMGYLPQPEMVEDDRPFKVNTKEDDNGK